VQQYEKVLDVLKRHGNKETVMLEDIRAECEIAGVNMYRISTYMWEIKTKTKYGVYPIKEGRKVVGYQLRNFEESLDTVA
jgi:hypothetical protein